MNFSFKSIFNRRTGTWQVVSEKTRNAGKTGSSVSKPLLAMLLGLSAQAGMAQVTIENGETKTVTAIATWTPAPAANVVVKNGKLILESGGAVGVNSLLVETGGEVIVNGTDSFWRSSNGIEVGRGGQATLTIENGGGVWSLDGTIATGDSTVSVKGAGSNWTSRNFIRIGYDGNATLTIADSGSVTSGSVVIGFLTTGAGTLNLNGTSGARGLLSTAYLTKNQGAAAFKWDGGILQATQNETNFLRNIAGTDIHIGTAGAYFDTNGHAVGIAAGQLTGAAANFTKLGDGVLTIAGGNTYGGNTTVSAGTLKFATYDQAAGQTLGIGVASESNYGKLDVTGVATFNPNANLNVEVASVPTLAIGAILADVISAGTLTANGFNVTDNSALFNFKAIQHASSVDLEVFANSSSGVLNAVNEHGLSSAAGAANVLDAQISNGATGDMGTVVTSLGQLTSNRDVSRATAQTLPIISDHQAIQGALSNVQRLVQNRIGGNAFGTGLSSGDPVSNKNGWGKLFGSRAEQDNRNGAAGFTANTWGLVLGGDTDVAPGARVGVAYSYAKTTVNGNADLSGTAQRANIDSHVISAYGSKDIGGNRTLSFQGDLGVNENESTRHINFGGLNRTARADYRTYSAHVGTAISQAFELNQKTTLTPVLRADYTWLKSQSYNERGADALNLHVNSHKSDAFVIGADAYLQHRISNTSRIDVNVGAGYDTINKQGNIVAAYAGAPGQSFVTTGINHSPWLMRGGIGYSMVASNGTEVSLRYDAEGRSDFLNHTASVRANWAF